MPNDTEPLDLEAIARRVAAATLGPWCAEEDSTYIRSGGVAPVGSVFEEFDAEFIAHSRTDMPALLAEVRRLREEEHATREELRAIVKEFGQYKEEVRHERSDHFARMDALRRELEDSQVHVQTLAGQLVQARREMVVTRPIVEAVARSAIRTVSVPHLGRACQIPESLVLAARAWRDQEQGQQPAPVIDSPLLSLARAVRTMDAGDFLAEQRCSHSDAGCIVVMAARAIAEQGQ